MTKKKKTIILGSCLLMAAIWIGPYVAEQLRQTALCFSACLTTILAGIGGLVLIIGGAFDWK